MDAIDTAIVSDIHLGCLPGADLVRNAEARARLCEELAKAERVVILGDLLELRERPVADVLADCEEALRDIGRAVAGKQLVIVPGNHDHEIVRPAIERARLAGGRPLPLEATFEPLAGELSGRLAELMPESEIVISYPGVRLRDDVWATHGHYLDLELTVPRPESILGSAIARHVGSREYSGADRYETALAPLYAFAHATMQTRRRRTGAESGEQSRDVWRKVQPDGDGGAAAWVIRRGVIPAFTAGLNALGLGPFRPDISATELRRSGLRAMAKVIETLAVEADHVVFGHTHRAGPLPHDSEGWVVPGGSRLHNTGTWLYEDVFLEGSELRGAVHPYYPGRVTWLRGTAAPEQVCVLEDVDVRGLAAAVPAR